METTQKCKSMCLACFSKLKAVFFTSGNEFVDSKAVWGGPGRPKRMCKVVFVAYRYIYMCIYINNWDHINMHVL